MTFNISLEMRKAHVHAGKHKFILPVADGLNDRLLASGLIYSTIRLQMLAPCNALSQRLHRQ